MESEETEPVKPKRKRGRPPGTPGGITRKIPYVCMVDGREHPRAELLAKSVKFQTLDKPHSSSSRTVGFICIDHMSVDPDYLRRPYLDSPGLKVAPDGNASSTEEA